MQKVVILSDSEGSAVGVKALKAQADPSFHSG
jgi:hypothetical protein